MGCGQGVCGVYSPQKDTHLFVVVALLRADPRPAMFIAEAIMNAIAALLCAGLLFSWLSPSHQTRQSRCSAQAGKMVALKLSTETYNCL